MVVALGDEVAHEGCADEACGSGYEYVFYFIHGSGLVWSMALNISTSSGEVSLRPFFSEPRTRCCSSMPSSPMRVHEATVLLMWADWARVWASRRVPKG